MTKYSSHYYYDPDLWEKSKVLEKERLSSNRMHSHALMHPHKYDEECGDLTHIRISPGKAPEETTVKDGDRYADQDF